MSNVQATFEIRVGMTSRQAVWCLLCVRYAVFLGLPVRFEGETGQKDKKGRAWTRDGWLVETATGDLRQCHDDQGHEHDTRRREVTVGKRAAAAGVQRPREASMPRGGSLR